MKKAIIPAAGRGTRLSPLTDYIPKELLPVGQKPMIQYTLEMYMASGIDEFFIITSPRKPQLKNFITGNWHPPTLPFEKDSEFFRRLAKCYVVFIEQPRPDGVADAISLTRDFVGSEPFACVMPDCLLFSETPLLSQLLTAFKRYQKCTIGAIRIPYYDVYRFGNVGILKTKYIDLDSVLITALSDKSSEPICANRFEIIEKGFGGGIYLPHYFDIIEEVRPLSKGEVDDVPVHQILARRGELIGVFLRGFPFDAGNLNGFRAAVRFVGNR